jgi:hypothetical protein
VVKVPLGEGEIEGVCRVLVELHDDREKRMQREASVRRFVESECHWGITAKRYLEHLEGFPRPNLKRTRIVAMKSALRRTPG